MKHPDREEWIPFVFGEVPAPEHKLLAEHLRQCPDCAREIDGWRRSLRRMDRWSLAKPQRAPLVGFVPVVKWALAALIIIGMGFMAGRMTVPKPVDTNALQAAMEASLRTSLDRQAQQILQVAQAHASNAVALAEARLANATAAENRHLWLAFQDALSEARAQDSRAVRALFQQFQKQHSDEMVALHKDLEILASTADEELRRARLGLVQLAAVAASNQ